MFITGLVFAGVLFLLAQLAVISIWTYLYQRHRKIRRFENSTIISQIPTTLPGSCRSDSMCKLYDTGYAGRNFS